MRYVLDSDILSYLLREREEVERAYREAIRQGAQFILAPGVRFEVTRYLRLKDSTRLLRRYAELTQQWGASELLGTDWDDAAELWKGIHQAGKSIQPMDLLIAVTTLKENAVLVSNNLGHFAPINLAVVNWAN